MLPKDELEMESSEWFNMWGKRNFPYLELLEGDILYWLDTHQKSLTWKTKVIEVERYPYSNKNDIWKRYSTSMQKGYYDTRPDNGYFLRYRIKVLEKINIPKPNYDFSQLGWERIDSVNFNRWFNEAAHDDETTLDYSIQLQLPLYSKLIELNEKMKYVAPERIKRLISITIRKDTNLINTLKKAAGFQCQYPYCGSRIRTKTGSYYIEVAHIEPVNKGGQSILGNLLVLCPNHHKEFDFGNLIIEEQTIDKLSGTLNDVPFIINLDFKQPYLA